LLALKAHLSNERTLENAELTAHAKILLSWFHRWVTFPGSFKSMSILGLELPRFCLASFQASSVRKILSPQSQISKVSSILLMPLSMTRLYRPLSEFTASTTMQNIKNFDLSFT
jgi:hypothetical protein